MNSNQNKFSDEKVSEIIELAAKLSIESDKKFSIEELVSVCTKAGISPDCIYQAIEQINNKPLKSTQSEFSSNKVLTNNFQEIKSKQKKSL